MIQVRVSGVSALRDVIQKDTTVSLRYGSTVGDLINVLDTKFGSAYKGIVGEALGASVRKRFSMIINGVFMSPEQSLALVLSDGDEIIFFQLAGA
jgi:molybdopterin converting factor small subunit